MKNYMNHIGKYVKSGLCLCLFAGLLSCGRNDNKDIPEEEVSMRVEETETFSGNVPTADSDKLYTDFAATDYFESWDEDNDNALNKDEFAKSLFSTWDTNADNMLDENEWDMAANDFGFKADENWNWEAWNSNNDNMISMDEFSTTLSSANLYEAWDENKNNALDKREYAEGLHGMWNEGKGELTEEDYDTKFNKYYDSNAKKYLPERG